MYVQLNGISQILNTLGLSKLILSMANGSAWTTRSLARILAALNQSASNATKSSVLPTAAELHDAEAQVESVNKQYIFTTDAADAVLVNQKYVGVETENGRQTDHYIVGYNKTHLEAYVTALSAALDNSSLNTWSKAANNGKSLSQELESPLVTEVCRECEQQLQLRCLG